MAARSVVIYYANNDLALIPSSVVNFIRRGPSRPLGLVGVRDLKDVADNVYQADCTSFSWCYERLGHGYFVDRIRGKDPTPVLKHILEIITAGEVRSIYRNIKLKAR